MKKLLILFTFVASTFVSAETYRIERDGWVDVYCVNGWVFVIARENGGMTQLMYYDTDEKAMRPLLCRQYKI